MFPTKLLVPILFASSVPTAFAAPTRRAAPPLVPIPAGVSTLPSSPTLAADLMRKSDAQTRGKSLESRIMLRVVRGRAIRTLELLLWAKGTDKAAVKVLSPAKERASAHLRLGTELWNYAPDVERVQKVAPSMLKQAWMGADFTNGDLVRSTNLSRYYDHKIVAREKIEGTDAWKIESRPRKGAPVEGGKIVTWLARSDAVPLRQEYFGEDGKLERTLVCTNFRRAGGHRYPATLVVTKAGDAIGNFTQVDYRTIRFDRPLDETIFTPEFLKKRIETPDFPK